jgi:hypothetical protein
MITRLYYCCDDDGYDMGEAVVVSLISGYTGR